MLQYVYGHDATVGRFVSQLIPHCSRGFPPDARTIGIINEDGQLIGGLVYHNYDQDAGLIEMSGSAIDPRWLTRGTLERMYGYPFLQLGCQMIVMRVAAENERVLRQLASYNYTFIKVPRMFGRGKDGVLCTLTFEEWIDNKFNKRLKQSLQEPALEEAA